MRKENKITSCFTETEIEDAITLALEDANKKRIYGKEVTPFILAAVAKVTGGASLAASILSNTDNLHHSDILNS